MNLLINKKYLYSEEISRLIKHSKENILVTKEKELEDLYMLVDQLKQREQTVSECLLIVLLGGTKVGKSTLINALAGEEISPTSSVACFTTKLKIYVHQTKKMVALIRLKGLIQYESDIFYHNNSSLENLIFIDTPDFDGVYKEHKEILTQVLQRADLVIVVLTTQKYDSNDLYQILSTSIGFRRVIFVFNRIDEGIPYTTEIEQDFIKKIHNVSILSPNLLENDKSISQIPIFALSAKNAFLQKNSKFLHLPIGEFVNFEEYLSKQLNTLLVHKISSENLREMYIYTIDCVNKVFNYDQLEVLCTNAYSLLQNKINEISSNLRLHSFEVISKLEPQIIFVRKSELISQYYGLFGMYLKFVFFIESVTSMLNLVLLTISNRLEMINSLAKNIYDSMKNKLFASQEELKLFIHEISYNYSLILHNKADSDGHYYNENFLSLELVLAKISDLLSDYAKCKYNRSVLLFFENIAFNFIPFAIVLFLVYYYLYGLYNRLFISSGVFIGGFVIVIMILYIESLIVFKVKGKKCDYLASEISNYLQDVMQEAVLKPFENRIKTLAQIIENWKKIKSDIENIDID